MEGKIEVRDELKLYTLSDINKYLLLYIGDLRDSEVLINHHPTDFSKRTYVRTLISAIEGTIFLLKQVVIIIDSYENKLSQNDKLLLLEKNVTLKDNVYRTSIVLSYTLNKSLMISKKANELDNLSKVIKIRNRITHPKRMEDFCLDEKNFNTCQAVGKWFINFVNDTYNGIEIFLMSKIPQRKLCTFRGKDFDSY